MLSPGLPSHNWRSNEHHASPDGPGPAGQVRQFPRQVLFASLVGTTIEFFDFYIYATAAVLVFPSCSFLPVTQLPQHWPPWRHLGLPFWHGPSARRCSDTLATRVGRKTTLVLALGTMGASTVSIGLLPGYHSIGIAAPLLLALCRFGQGIGLGGEWGGAVLLAIENAPAGSAPGMECSRNLGAPSASSCLAACS